MSFLRTVPYLLCLILGLALAWVYADLKQTETDFATYRAQVAQDKQKQAEAFATLVANHRKTELQIRESFDAERKKLNEQVSSSSKLADSLRKRLRDAQSAARLPSSSNPPQAGEAAAGGSEPLVPGTIGEEDVDEAERAELIRAHLIQCYNLYDKVSDATNRP